MEQLTQVKSSQKQEGPSDRSWGLSFAFLSFLLAFGARASLPFLIGFGVLGLVFAITALRFSFLLSSLNRRWMFFSEKLAGVTNPILLGLIFFLVLTPLGLTRRALKGRILVTGADPELDSYWIPRHSAAVNSQSLRRLF